MANISRDSLKDTKSALAELRGLIPAGQSGVRHYVGVRQQQAVPVLDADWNELEDIRRLDLEIVLANTIGNGVPAGSDGFHILPANAPNSILIADGVLFLDGWLAYNRAAVTYANQPYRNARVSLRHCPTCRTRWLPSATWHISMRGNSRPAG